MSLTKFHEVLIDDPALIIGFLKEALFFSRDLRIQTDTGFYNLEIDSIDENPGSNKILLRSPSKINLPLEQETDFHCPFPHLTAAWKASINAHGPDLYASDLPTSIKISNSRDSLRLSPVTDRAIETTVLITTGDYHCEGHLVVEQISVNGVGGKLSVPIQMPIQIDSSVIGKVELETGSVAVNANIVHASLIESAGKFETTYRIGIVQSRKTNLQVNDSTINRRQSLRHAAKFALAVRSPLHPLVTFSLEVINASATGFAATPPESSARPLVPLGAGVKIEGTSLVAEVLGVDPEFIRFQFISGSRSDRLAWIKRLSGFESPSTSIGTAIGFDLVSLFCQSGALSIKYIQNQRGRLPDISKQLSLESGKEGWVHRWLERTPDGAVRGHIGAVMMGDNLWHLGEIAGSPVKNSRVSPTFMPRFFRYMREYALSCTPCPKLVIAWNQKHRYWSEFQHYLDGPGKDSVRSGFNANYFRTDPKQINLTGAISRISVTEITSEDYNAIEKIIESCPHQTWSEFLMSLGFSVDGFGSPGLQKLFSFSGSAFRRKYFALQSDSCEVLAIVSTFPANSSFNRTFDVAWIFPISKQAISESQRNGIIEKLLSFSATNGFSIPGVLIPEGVISPLSTTKSMRWTIVHPQALAFFDEKTK